jgi:hypothetical protein
MSSPFFLLSLSLLSRSSLLILSSHLFACLGSSNVSSRQVSPSWLGRAIHGAASREIGNAQQQHRPASSPTSVGLRGRTHRGPSPVSSLPLLFFFSFSCTGLLFFSFSCTGLLFSFSFSCAGLLHGMARWRRGLMTVVALQGTTAARLLKWCGLLQVAPARAPPWE